MSLLYDFVSDLRQNSLDLAPNLERETETSSLLCHFYTCSLSNTTESRNSFPKCLYSDIIGTVNDFTAVSFVSNM